MTPHRALRELRAGRAARLVVDRSEARQLWDDLLQMGHDGYALVYTVDDQHDTASIRIDWPATMDAFAGIAPRATIVEA